MPGKFLRTMEYTRENTRLSSRLARHQCTQQMSHLRAALHTHGRPERPCFTFGSKGFHFP
jgi:hypothetical protein